MDVERKPKIVTNIKCYGARSTFPIDCFTYKELVALSKHKKIPSVGTKKELAKKLKIPYFEYTKLQGYGFQAGAHEYPSCRVYNAKYFKSMKKHLSHIGSVPYSSLDENRLLGMILYNMIADNLEYSLISSEDETTFSIDFVEFEKRVPRIPIDKGIKVYNDLKPILSVVQKVTENYHLEDEIKEQIASYYLEFIGAFTSNRIVKQVQPMPYTTKILKLFFIGLYERYKFIYNIKKEYKYYYAKDEQGPRLFRYDMIGLNFLNIHQCNLIEHDLIRGIYYINFYKNETDENGYPDLRWYLIKDDCQCHEIIKCETLDHLLGFVKESEVNDLIKGLEGKIKVCINSFEIKNFMIDKFTNQMNQLDANTNKIFSPYFIGATTKDYERAISETKRYLNFKTGSDMESFENDIINDLQIQQSQIKPKSPTKHKSPTKQNGDKTVIIQLYSDKSYSLQGDFGNTYITFKDVVLKGQKLAVYNNPTKKWFVSIKNIDLVKTYLDEYKIPYLIM